MDLNLGRTEFGETQNSGNVMSEEEAYQLLDSWVENTKLSFHMEQVAYLMRAYAEAQGYTEQVKLKWFLAGLLHDADWDQWPEQHCKKIIEELESRKIDPEIIHAIASHGPKYFGVEPISEMDKMLYAFDELSGLIHAYSLMRPQGYDGMEVKGVKKRLKDKNFAAQVSREDIADASVKAGISIDELVQFVIENQLRESDRY